MSDKKRLHEDFIQKFSHLLGGLAAGVGIAKVSNMLKGKKKAKQALDDYVKDSERLKSKFEKRLRAMPEKDREDLMNILDAMG